MSKIFFVILIAGVIVLNSGCSPQEEKPAILIGNVNFSAAEFNSAFLKSPYANSPTKENRKAFLNTFISRRAILKEAVDKGLDKDPKLLESIQFFWEQSLLKLALDKKIKELSSQVQISDKEIKDYYDAHKAELSPKNLNQVSDQIKLQLFIEKQKKTLEAWMQLLVKKDRVKIDYKLLGID